MARARIIVEIKGGCLYGIIADQGVDVTILDYDAQEAGIWDVDIDPGYVAQNWVSGYESASKVEKAIWGSDQR